MRRRTTLAKPPARLAGFTLIEIMVAVAVLVILILFVAQLTNSVTAITRVGTKHMDADTQARTVLDRLGFDIGRMIRRNDLDYYIKGPASYTGHGNGHGWGKKLTGGQQGSDRSPRQGARRAQIVHLAPQRIDEAKQDRSRQG